LLSVAILYNYLLYPIILKFVSRFRKSDILFDENFKPEITVIIAAFNEEELIAEAVNSIFKGNYPADKIKVIIGSDGSTDDTNNILADLAAKYSNLSYHIFERGGKNNTLNKIIPLAKTEILVMMDADIRLNHNALSILVGNFNDSKVGGVIATQNLENETEDNSGSVGVLIYQKYENFLKQYESQIDSCVNAFGYFYGIRKKYFKPIASDLLCDDMFTIYSVLENKGKVVFAGNSKVNEVREKSLENEKHRRLRASAGGMATVYYFKNLLNIFKFGWVSFFIISHKISRWTTPYFMILLAILTLIFQSDTILYYVIAVAQIILYTAAFAGFIVEKYGINLSIFRPFLFFVVINYALLLGSIRFFQKAQNAVWDRTGFKS
jgi:cellulose synthase/poly-beta-1,6-N-acetylglucosamine synthase-like glycosyltransferase